jgi:hypothetical protein
LLPAAFEVAVAVAVAVAFVGAAEGCDLLILLFKIKVKRSQPSAAPTGGGFVVLRCKRWLTLS